MSSRRKPSFAQVFRPLNSRASRSRKASIAEENPAFEAIWHVVSSIPRGQVSTYGAVARAAGLPGRARQAGKALSVAPEELSLPWHRVLGAGGRIVFPTGSREFREQSKRLKAEGVKVQGGRVPGSVITTLEEL